MKVGDQVFIVESSYKLNADVKPKPAEVTKVGRIWITVQFGHREERFDKTTLAHDFNWGNKVYLYPTVEAYQEYTEAIDLNDKITRYMKAHTTGAPLSVLRQIWSLLNPEADDKTEARINTVQLDNR